MKIMKNTIVITAALTLILTSCSSTKQTSTNQTETVTEQVSTEQNVTTANTNSETSNTSVIDQQNTAAQANGSTGAMNNVMAKGSATTTRDEYADMFTKLEMSNEQISTFTAAMNRFKTKQANTPSGEMLGSIESERTRQLEEILSSGQYAKYEEWLVNNQ